jgi:hypothetical protein
LSDGIALPESVDIALPAVEGIDDFFNEKDALEEASFYAVR